MKFFEKLKQLNRMSFFNKNLGKSQRYTAFTLAEVLITLGIIGVVAMMTIPNLIQNTQEWEFRASWKEAYSLISQATQQMITDNGDSLDAVCTDGNQFTDADCMIDAYTQYFKKSSENSSNQVVDTSISNITYRYLDGSDMKTKYEGNYFDKFSHTTILNGMMIWIYRLSSSNSGIFVDVNGSRPPNTVGKDIYRLWLSQNGVKPAGYSGDTYVYTKLSTCNTSSTGWGCSAKYLYQ